MLMKNRLDKRKNLGNFRSLRTSQNLIDFASNDYLGLARSEKLKKKWVGANELGSTGSRLLTGHTSYVEELENHIAYFHGYEAGLLFNCGYMANIGLADAIATKEDVFFFDMQIHASLHEGMRASQAKIFPFRHNDLEHLENRLKKNPSKGNRFICIESIYSTDGSMAPLKEIYNLAQTYGAHLIVDEAHAIGIFGQSGKGLVFENGLAGKIFAQIVTFGKALGTFGAIVLGNQLLKETLINFAKPFIYSTALPLHCLIAIKCSYALFPNLEKERSHLKSLIEITSFSSSHIQPIYISGNREALTLSKKIADKGFDVRAFLSPTVQRGKELLRICLHAFNSKEELITLLNII